MKVKGAIVETLIVRKDVQVEVPNDLAKKAALGSVIAQEEIEEIIRENAYEECIEWNNGWDGIDTVEIEVEQEKVSVGDPSEPENLKVLGFSEDEIKLLLGLKQASDNTYEESRCGVEFNCSVTSDAPDFEAHKSLASKGYLFVNPRAEQAAGFNGWVVPPGKTIEVFYYPTLKFSALMGALCPCHKRLKKETQ